MTQPRTAQEARSLAERALETAAVAEAAGNEKLAASLMKQAEQWEQQAKAR
jgi:hypothetical protein